MEKINNNLKEEEMVVGQETDDEKGGETGGELILKSILSEKDIDNGLQLSKAEVISLKESIEGLDDKNVISLKDEDIPKLHDLVFKGYYEEAYDINEFMTVVFRTITPDDIHRSVKDEVGLAFNHSDFLGHESSKRQQLKYSVSKVILDDGSGREEKEFEFDKEGKGREDVNEWLSNEVSGPVYQAMYSKYLNFIDKMRIISQGKVVKKS